MDAELSFCNDHYDCGECSIARAAAIEVAYRLGAQSQLAAAAAMREEAANKVRSLINPIAAGELTPSMGSPILVCGVLEQLELAIRAIPLPPDVEEWLERFGEAYSESKERLSSPYVPNVLAAMDQEGRSEKA